MRAVFSRILSGTASSTSPIRLARRASTARPVSIMSSAAAGPMRLGSHCTPCQVGMMPSITSGKAKRVFGSSSATRYLQASASSSPPPMQKPFTRAVVGKGRRESLSNTSQPKRVNPSASSASLKRVNSSTSAPATKPSLAERMIRPVGRAAAISSSAAASSSSASREKVLVDSPCLSNVSQTSPCASLSQRKCFITAPPPASRRPARRRCRSRRCRAWCRCAAAS